MCVFMYVYMYNLNCENHLPNQNERKYILNNIKYYLSVTMAKRKKLQKSKKSSHI